MSVLDELRARGLTSFQLRLLAASTGCPVTAAEADARAVVERLERDPVRRQPWHWRDRRPTGVFAVGKFTRERLL